MLKSIVWRDEEREEKGTQWKTRKSDSILRAYSEKMRERETWIGGGEKGACLQVEIDEVQK